MKIILVEDQQDILLYERVILERAGHEVIAPVLYSWLFDEDLWDGVDVAIIDLGLPGKTTGREILAWLETHLPRVRRICVTGAEVQVAQDVHAHAIVHKPFYERELLKEVERGKGDS